MKYAYEIKPGKHKKEIKFLILKRETMKIRTLLFVFASLLLASTLIAQDTIVIDGGSDNGGLLETTINGDTTATGERNNPNRVYELKADEFYLQHGPINVNNPDGTIIIRGQDGGAKPVILKQPLNEIAIGRNQINSSLTIQNVQYHGLETNYWMHWVLWNIYGDNHHLLVEDCLFEYAAGCIFNLNNVSTGAEIVIRNTYFRDLHIFVQWWAGRVVQCRVPVDIFIFENNTVSGGGLTIQGDECLFDYAVINHNTFINNHKYPFVNQYWKEVYFTNNLFVNANMAGEDMENVATGDHDPDALLHGISGVDTIEVTIAIQGKYLNADSTALTEEVDELSDIIYYSADNVVVSSATLDNYYSGGLNDVYDDAPASYLNWGGVEGPFKVLNVPGIWSNSRTEALIADWENIKEENNNIYEMRAADLGLGTEVLPQDAADIFIQWNRNQWGVPGVEMPTMQELFPYFFGDFNPATIPGIETENSTEGGITKISDMVEDFSYTTSLVSKSDGLRIGALHWNDEAFDRDASIAAVKNAYNGIYIGIDDPVVNSESEFDLKNYPNPFTSFTTISFNLLKNSHVKLSVYDVSGRVVETLIDENMTDGKHTVQFTPDYASSSTYFYKLTTDYSTVTRKMTLLK